MWSCRKPLHRRTAAQAGSRYSHLPLSVRGLQGLLAAWVAVAFSLLPAMAGAAATGTDTRDFRLGRAATPAEIAGWDIDVRPDGAGLPDAHGSVAEGEAVYEQHCEVCHGTFGESNSYMALAGGIGSLKTDSPVSTVGSRLNFATTLYDYIGRAMPFTQAKSLTPAEVYAVTAYVLNLNDIVDDGFVADRKTLPAVQMPNRDGFARFRGLSDVDGRPDTDNVACMQDCPVEGRPAGAIPAAFIENMYGSLTTHFRALATMNDQVPSAEALPPARQAAASPQELIRDSGCTACHGVDRKIIGPAFRSVAARFGKEADGAATLTKAIRDGSSGAWGSVPMPAQTGPSDADLQVIVRWILDGAPDS